MRESVSVRYFKCSFSSNYPIVSYVPIFDEIIPVQLELHILPSKRALLAHL